MTSPPQVSVVYRLRCEAAPRGCMSAIAIDGPPGIDVYDLDREVPEDRRIRDLLHMADWRMFQARWFCGNHATPMPPRAAPGPFVPVPKRPTANMKLQPDEWCQSYGVKVHDPDGWRDRGASHWTEPITLVEFSRRAAKSTTDAANPAWDGVARDARLCEADAAGQESTP